MSFTYLVLGLVEAALGSALPFVLPDTPVRVLLQTIAAGAAILFLVCGLLLREER